MPIRSTKILDSGKVYHIITFISVCCVSGMADIWCPGHSNVERMQISVIVAKNKCFWCFQLRQVMLEIRQGLKMVQFKVLTSRANT